MADLSEEFGRHGGRRVVPTGRASLDGRRPDEVARAASHTLDDDGYNPSTYSTTRSAAAVGDLYNAAAASSHDNLQDLVERVKPVSGTGSKMTRPAPTGSKPNRSESGALDDGAPISVESLLNNSRPGLAASQRAEATVAGKAADGGDDNPEYKQTEYVYSHIGSNTDTPAGVNRQSSHLDLADAPTKI